MAVVTMTAHKQMHCGGKGGSGVDAAASGTVLPAVSLCSAGLLSHPHCLVTFSLMIGSSTHHISSCLFSSVIGALSRQPQIWIRLFRVPLCVTPLWPIPLT